MPDARFLIPDPGAGAEIAARVAELVGASADLTGRETRLEETLDGLGLDSLDMAELAMGIEDEFAVDLLAAVTPDMTVAALADLVAARRAPVACPHCGKRLEAGP